MTLGKYFALHCVMGEVNTRYFFVSFILYKLVSYQCFIFFDVYLTSLVILCKLLIEIRTMFQAVMNNDLCFPRSPV